MFHQIGERKKISRNGHPAYRTEHPPFRMYYIVRNNLRLWALFGKEFPEFVRERKENLLKVRFRNLLFYERQKIKRLGYVLKGISDYLLGKYGALK